MVLSCVWSPHWSQEKSMSPGCSYMSCQSTTLTEPLITLITMVRFLFCVGSYMYDQMIFITETFITLITWVRFFSCVHSHMCCHMITSSESFTTLADHKINVFSYVSSEHYFDWNTSHSDHISKVSLLCVFWYELPDEHFDWNTYHT